MRITSFLYLLYLAVELSKCWSIYMLPRNYPQEIYQITYDEHLKIYQNGFGVWSRYTPLSNIQQIGEIGILDSNCFNLFNIKDSVTNELHFVQYECINFETQSIKKYFQFLSHDRNSFKEEILINDTSYESTWYFQGILKIPQENIIYIVLYKQQNEIFAKQIQFEFLFEENNYNIVIGGDLIVSQNSPLYTLENRLLSFFPGDTDYLFSGIFLKSEYYFSIIEEYQNDECDCRSNEIERIEDVQIEKKGLYEFISREPNCYEFLLSGWIKIQEIIQMDEELYYQLIRLSANFQDSPLVDANLCAFQLFYKLSQQRNQIIITTYSYTFPSVNIDFSNNPFLKTETIDIDWDIKLWHYILVEKKQNLISISIKFYKGFDQKVFIVNFDVIQFNMMQFKLLYGNIFQSQNNFLTIQIVDFQLIKCSDESKPQVSCHPTCQECDGPTRNDCLSCFETSNRRFLEDFKECICEYGTIDQNDQCINYKTLQNTLIQGEPKQDKCKYGFFEYEDECIQCPSIINNNLITCLECLQNPKQWAQTFLCDTNLFTNKNGNIAQYFEKIELQYYLLGNDLQYCSDCDVQNTNPNYNNVQQIFEFKTFCKISQKLNDECYFCGQNCDECEILQTNLSCSQIYSRFNSQGFNLYQEKPCDPPNFKGFSSKCFECKIPYCLYCFNYLASDPTKTTLGFYQSYTLIDEEIKVGCAQCIDGFIYKFQIGECIYQRPSQENCLRSFFNLENQEICTLSAINDFNIAFEIINCQNHILNCQQCIETPQQTLRCLICQDGYYAQTHSGICLKCEHSNATKCCEYSILEYWKWLIQGFIMKFLPNRPIFSGSLISSKTQAIECIQGYKLYGKNCQKYCDENCSVCESLNNYDFTCSKCSLNYYKETMKVQIEGKCIQCPSLCQVCQNRSIEEIKKINPYFTITPENIMYSFKCIQKIPLQSVQIDPNLQIAQNCFENNCNYNLEYYFVIYYLIQNDLICNHLENIVLILQEDYNYIYSNEIGLQQVTLLLQINEECVFYSSDQYIENDFKEQIFSIQQTSLKIQSSNNPLIILDYLYLDIFKFDSIIFSHLQFQINLDLDIKLLNDDQPINLNIHDTEFYSIVNNLAQMSIKTNKFLNFNLQNISFFDISIVNSLIFDIICVDSGDDLIIINLLLRNCILTNSTLFQFQNSRRNIQIKHIMIDSCQFNNSTFAKFNITQNEFSQAIFNKVSIINSFFQNSILIHSPQKTAIHITDFSFIQNQFMNSKFIIFNYDFYCYNLIFKENYVNSFQLISQISSIQEKQEIYMNNIQINENTVNYFSIFITEQKQSTSQVIVQLSNFYFKDNVITCNQEQQLIIFNCYSLLMQNIYLKNTTNFQFISLFAIPFIRIENLVYENQIQELKVRISSNCFQNCFPHSQLLIVSGFTEIILNQIKILNQFSVDQSIISIQSNSLIMLTKQEYIRIQDILVNGNIIIKQNIGIIISLIEIMTTKSSIIEIENLKFYENVFHQYYEDPSETFASLLYIDSRSSFMILKNIICTNNSITNSSSAYISISSNQIQIENFQVNNHNYIDQEFWIKYYEIQIQGDFNQNEISYIISNIYKIENVGGSLSIQATKFTFFDGVFYFIQAKGSQIFNINLQIDGIVIIQNCKIAHAYNSFISKTQNDGAITINAKKSLFSLYLENITLFDVINKLSSSILTIYPSPSQNNIQIKNIIVKDCFSLVNQILDFEFDFQNAQQNIVKLQNFRIISTENAFYTFLQFLGKLSLIDLQKIINNNAILNFLGCSLTLIDNQIEGIILSSVLKISDSKQIIVMNTLFINILTFYPLYLVEVQQSNNLQSKIYFNNMKIQNFNDLKFKNQNYNYFNFNHIGLNLNQCSPIISYIDQQIIQKELIQTFFENVLVNSNKNGSLIKITSFTNQTSVIFSKISVLNNDCQYCYNGLLYFNINDFKQIQISELCCIKNNIINYGCIFAKSDRKVNHELQIKDSTFISNNGRQGSGILVQNLKFKLLNSKIINNNATYKGGGFYFEEGSDRFIIQSTIICDNKAEEAGGVYLDGNSSLNNNNFIKSILLFNQAQSSSNNINELPLRLTLSINQNEMFSSEHIIENHSYQVLTLKPFQILSQENVVKSNFLLIPSGQYIQNYQIYNTQFQKYQSYIHEFSMILKNSRNEKQINFYNSTCKIYQQIFDIQLQKVIEYTQISMISFNYDTKSFNLSSLEFNLDPYNQDNKIQEILIYCNTQYQQESLAYRMRVNSFLCQLGEFYIFSGCQKCKSEQGFYSVTYNTTKCSIFDKNKFEAITSNKIQLKPGFWRPNQISDYIEYCYKNPIHCLGGWNVGNDICSMGHIGGYCEECDRFDIRGDGKFFKNQQQLDCQKCQDVSKRFLAFFLISIWAILSTLLTIKSIEKSNQLFAQLKIRQNFTEILFKLNQDHESILLKLFLNYIWVFSLIFTFNISFSFSLNFVKQSNDTSYFMANYFECFLAEISGMELMYSRILVMFGLMASQILIIFLGFQILSKYQKSKFHSRIISITCLYLYIQNYASLINQFFQILAIRKISNLDYISGDVSLIYGSQNHITWIYAFAIPGSIIIGLILPLSLFLILYIKKDQHNKIKFRRHIGYLFNEYNKKNYFWEMIKLWKKTIIIIILIYFETDIFLKASLLGLCLLIYQLIALHYKPYILKKFNISDIKSSHLCQIAIFLALIKYICEQQDQQNIQTIIQILIIFDSIILSYPFIIDILRVYYSKYRLQILQLLLQAFQTFKPNFVFTKFLRKKLQLISQKEKRVQINIQKMKKLIFLRNFGTTQVKNSYLQSATSQTKPIQITLNTNLLKQK
ncbi:unnamed protein product [Paramecium sonneborni]|uniref:Transmembrane protein n=1 Tax=Paramecium sonneborni TaxID=65129 RepID=A0A8S1Q0A0_9CILI|nr:unnamed protein product [Paramecium sonneborni]